MQRGNNVEKIQKIKGFLWIRYEIFDNKNLSSSAKLVYMALMRYINNKTKECYPSIAKIAFVVGLHKETVEIALRALEKERYIYIQRKSGQVNRYTILEPTSQIFPTGGEMGIGVGGNGETNNTYLTNSISSISNRTNVDLTKYAIAIKTLNKATGRNFRTDNRKNLGKVKARVNDGSSIEEVCEIVKFICKKRMGTDYEMYLRPSTIFNRTKFENYKEEYKYVTKDLTKEQKYAILNTETLWNKDGTLKDLD